MDDAVINGVRTAYREQGYSTLRFNYRGVGASEGTPDCDAGTREDLASAIAYLADRDKRRVDIAGYSFGAWLALMTVTSRSRARRAILIAPPVDTDSFLGASNKIRLVVAGTEDHFASLSSLERLVPRWSTRARLAIIPAVTTTSC